MELSDQCVSLELAKRLKGLGILKSSIFGWIYYKHEPNTGWYIIHGSNNHKPFIWGGDDCKLQEQKDREVAAYSASELSELLPSVIHGASASESSYSLNIYKPNENWHINYSSGHKTKIVYYAKTLADCMAGILICLITMGIIKND